MSTEIVIVGCGGHGREVLMIIRAINDAARTPPWHVRGFLDDDPSPNNRERVRRLGVEVFGTVDRLADMPAQTRFVVGIGDPRIRRAVVARISMLATPAGGLIHPAATVGPDATVGDGVVVFPGARVSTNVTLGRHTHLNQNATVGHDSVLSDHVSVHPLAAISGDCVLETGALIGTTAAVLPGLRIGADAVVGAGACVVRDVAPGTVVKGVPARPALSLRVPGPIRCG